MVGSSHVDRNGPTKFYPTIREARRGSGPRPTAATARSARAAFLRVELRLSSDRAELRARERRGRRAREGEEAWWRWCNTVYGESDERAYPRVSPEGATPAKGVVVGVTFPFAFPSRNSARVFPWERVCRYESSLFSGVNRVFAFPRVSSPDVDHYSSRDRWDAASASRETDLRVKVPEWKCGGPCRRVLATPRRLSGIQYRFRWNVVETSWLVSRLSNFFAVARRVAGEIPPHLVAPCPVRTSGCFFPPSWFHRGGGRLIVRAHGECRRCGRTRG